MRCRTKTLLAKSSNYSTASKIIRFCALATALAAMSWQSWLLAQSDDFNDGQDTSPVAWMHYDGINAVFAAGPQDS
jgi:hypothetical protein